MDVGQALRYLRSSTCSRSSQDPRVTSIGCLAAKPSQVRFDRTRSTDHYRTATHQGRQQGPNRAMLPYWIHGCCLHRKERRALPNSLRRQGCVNFLISSSILCSLTDLSPLLFVCRPIRRPPHHSRGSHIQAAQGQKGPIGCSGCSSHCHPRWPNTAIP